MQLDNLLLLFADPFRAVYDEPPAPDPEDPPADPTVDPPVDPPKPKPKPKVTFTPEQQAYLNSILAEEKRKTGAATDKLITQLETYKNQAGTTAAEKEQLAARIDELKNTQLTEAEMRAKEEKKQKKKHDDEIAASSAEAKKWKELFHSTTIKRAITDAAVIEKAHNPRHIVNELFGNTRLVEELDEDNKPTGELIPKVRINTVKDGKPQTLEFGVTEAVKFLKEQDEHAPLFNSGATGGLGGNPNKNQRRGASNPDEPPTDPAAYREWRKANRDKLGVPKR